MFKIRIKGAEKLGELANTILEFTNPIKEEKLIKENYKSISQSVLNALANDMDTPFEERGWDGVPWVPRRSPVPDHPLLEKTGELRERVNQLADRIRRGTRPVVAQYSKSININLDRSNFEEDIGGKARHNLEEGYYIRGYYIPQRKFFGILSGTAEKIEHLLRINLRRIIENTVLKRGKKTALKRKVMSSEEIYKMVW